MHSVHALPVYYEPIGVFTITLRWLRDRNRLHGPSPGWTQTSGHDNRLASVSTNIGVTSAVTHGTPAAPPCRIGRLSPSSFPPDHPTASCAAAAALEAVGAAAAAVATSSVSGSGNGHAYGGSNSWARTGPRGGAGTVSGRCPPANGASHHEHPPRRRPDPQPHKQPQQGSHPRSLVHIHSNDQPHFHVHHQGQHRHRHHRLLGGVGALDACRTEEPLSAGGTMPDPVEQQSGATATAAAAASATGTASRDPGLLLGSAPLRAPETRDERRSGSGGGDGDVGTGEGDGRCWPVLSPPSARRQQQEQQRSSSVHPGRSEFPGVALPSGDAAGPVGGRDPVDGRRGADRAGAVVLVSAAAPPPRRRHRGEAEAQSHGGPSQLAASQSLLPLALGVSDERAAVSRLQPHENHGRADLPSGIGDFAVLRQRAAATRVAAPAVVTSATARVAEHPRGTSGELPPSITGQPPQQQPQHPYRRGPGDQLAAGQPPAISSPKSMPPTPPAAAAATVAGGPSSSRPGGAALSAAIRAAVSLDELADLYEAQRDGFRSGHVSAALGRLPHAARLRAMGKPRLAAPRHEALLRELLVRFEAHRAAGEYGTRDLSACAWVLGTLGRRERAEMVAELAAHMLALRRRHLRGRLAAADGSDGAGPAADGGDTTLTATSAPGRASKCSPLDLSNMALGMAKAGVTWPPLWQQLAEAAAAANLNGFGPQETANLAWSLAQAHREYCRRDAAAAAAMAAVADGTVGRSSGRVSPKAGEAGEDVDERDIQGDEDEDGDPWRGFAAWPAGCGVSGAAPPPPTAPRALHPAWRPWASHFVEDVLAPRLRSALWHCSPQQAANAAWALATLGHGSARTLGVLAAAAAVAAEAAAPPPQVPQVPPEAPPQVPLQARRPGARRAAPPLTPQGVCMLVWAMATMVTTRRSLASPGASGGKRRSCSGSDTEGRTDGVDSGGSRGTNNTRSKRGRSLGQDEAISSGSLRDSRSSCSSSSSCRDTRGTKSTEACSDGSNFSSGISRVCADSATTVTTKTVRSAGGATRTGGPLSSPPPPPEPPPPPPGGPADTYGSAVDPRALLALVRVACSRPERLTGQGLSNLLWGLGVLGFRSPREVLELATREALLRLPEMRPLGLTTLVEDWVRSWRYHPELFAAVAQRAAAQLRGGLGPAGGDGPDGDGADAEAWRPRTLARLLRAYGAVGHADRRLFLAAAVAMLGRDGRGGDSHADAAAVGRWRGGGSGGGERSAPLDELVPAELYQLACAYGRVGVHSPGLMDEMLARLAPVLTSAASPLPPRAAGRLLCALAVLGHRPAAAVHAADCVGGAEGEAAAAAATAAFRALRRSVLPHGLVQMTSRHALAAVWALARLRAARAPEVLRVAQLLARRAAPSASGLAAGLVAVARTPTVSGSPQALARLVWVLGRGAAAAAEDAERLRAAAGKAGAAMAVGAAEAKAGAAAGIFRELGGAVQALAWELLGREGPGVEELPEEVLVALAEALAVVLASAPRTGAPVGAAMALYDMLYSNFLTVAEHVLRRGASVFPGSPPRPRRRQQPNRLAARDLAAFVHAMYDSGVVASQPSMRVAAARQVLYRLQAAAAAAAADAAGGTGAPGPSSGTASDLAARSRPQQTTRSPAPSPLPPPQRPRQQQDRQPPRPHQHAPPRLPLDDLARLLAAAARLGLFEHPLAQPLLRDTSRALIASAPPPPDVATRAADAGGAVAATGGAHHHGVGDAADADAGADDAGTALGAAAARPAASPGPLGTSALQDLLRHCWPEAGLDQGTATIAGGSAGGGVRPARTVEFSRPAGYPAAAAAAAALSGGRALRRALWSWAARQAVPVLPWLEDGLQAQVLLECAVETGQTAPGRPGVSPVR